MVEFTEQATLVVRDQATVPLRRLNSTLQQLNRTANNLKSKKIDFNTTVAEQKLKRLSDRVSTFGRRKVSANADINTGAANNKLTNLNKRLTTFNSRVVRANVQLGTSGGFTPTTVPRVSGGRGSPATAPAMPSGTSYGQQIAAGFRRALRPAEIGRNVGRGFTFAVTGELYFGLREVAATAFASPLNTEDAVQRLRATGTSQASQDFVIETANQITSEFPATTAAGIINSAVEAVGRVADPDSEVGRRQIEASLRRIAQNTQEVIGVLGVDVPNASNQARIIEGVISQFGATTDPVLAAEFGDAAMDIIQAAGGDLAAGDIKRLTQQLSVARSFTSPDTLRQLGLLRDEGGRRSTGEFRQLFTDIVRGNINDEDFDAQIAAGLRDQSGKSLIAESLGKDFFGTVESFFIPALKELGVDITDATAVNRALDVNLGLTKEGGLQALTDAVINFDERVNEFNRLAKQDRSVFIEDPTTRARAQALSAQFQNVASDALSPLLPIAGSALTGLTDALIAIDQDEAGVVDYAALGGAAAAAAIPLALTTGLQALGDEESRPLGLAALSLSGAGTALTGAATALTGAAAAGGAPASLLKKLAPYVPTAAVIALGVKNTFEPNRTERAIERGEKTREFFKSLLGFSVEAPEPTTAVPPPVTTIEGDMASLQQEIAEQTAVLNELKNGYISYDTQAKIQEQTAYVAALEAELDAFRNRADVGKTQRRNNRDRGSRQFELSIDTGKGTATTEPEKPKEPASLLPVELPEGGTFYFDRDQLSSLSKDAFEAYKNNERGNPVYNEEFLRVFRQSQMTPAEVTLDSFNAVAEGVASGMDRFDLEEIIFPAFENMDARGGSALDVVKDIEEGILPLNDANKRALNQMLKMAEKIENYDHGFGFLKVGAPMLGSPTDVQYGGRVFEPASMEQLQERIGNLLLRGTNTVVDEVMSTSLTEVSTQMQDSASEAAGTLGDGIEDVAPAAGVAMGQAFLDTVGNFQPEPRRQAPSTTRRPLAVGGVGPQ